MRTIAILALVTGMTACAPVEREPATVARADLKAADGSPRGIATVSRAGGVLRLTVAVTGMAPGTKGIHVHTVGRCDGPDFQTAGGHWNPTGRQHGRDNPMGAHSGDLPNLVVAADGRGTLTADLPGSAAELMDADGATIVIHAAPDDYRTDPSGNSGARIACGVLVAG